MIRISFSPTDLEDVAEAIDNPETPEKFRRKLLTLRMHANGVEHQVIARVLCITPNSVTAYLKEYRQGGLGATLEDRSYRPSSSLEPFLDCLRCSFRAWPPATVKEAMARIEKLTGVKLGEEQTRRTLKKLGLRYRKSAQIPGKADPQLQFEFFTEHLEPRLAEAAQGLRKLFFVDAAHFVLGCFLGMIWSFSRLFVKGSSGRQRYNVLAAVDSHSKEVLSVRSTDYITASSVCALMELIRQTHPKVPVTLVLDNARYQRCQAVQEQALALDMELLYLPTYSPNLNLIERLWKFVRANCLRNKYFANFKLFKETLDRFFDSLNVRHQTELESLLTLEFQFFPNHKS